MARLTHLTEERNAASIRRGGIRTTVRSDDVEGVFAMPLLANYFVSHQWLRELWRQHTGPLVTVDFVIPDEEPVLAGHYSSELIETTAAEAAGVIMAAEDARGYEVLVPRKVKADEVKRMRTVNRVVGWRYWPDAHGRPPCSCDFCQRGTYGAAKIRAGA